MFYKIKEGIQNLIVWFPIIWNDRQWDHHYFTLMMRKKLKLMEDYFEDGGIIVDSKKVAKQIRMARIAIERINKDEYENVLYDRHEKKWGELKFDFDKHTISHTKVLTGKDRQKEQKESKRIHEGSEKQKQQDVDLFCKMFKKYLFHWWE